MNEIKCYDSDGKVLKQLYQWDLNQYITIKGYTHDDAPMFHMCHRSSELAIPVVPTVIDDGLKVAIPNELLQEAEPICIYAYRETDDDGARSKYINTILVMRRPKPGDYVYESNVKYPNLVSIESDLERITEEIASLESDINSLSQRQGSADAEMHDLAKTVDYLSKKVESGVVPDAPDDTPDEPEAPAITEVDADKVIFPEDLLATTEIGYVTLENGQAIIPAAGKSITQVWNMLFVQESDPTVSQPSVSVSCPQSKAYEVGSSVSPSYAATLKPGSYSYGPDTGIVAKSWTVTDTDGNSSGTSSGTFPSFTVADDTNYKITATAKYDDGAIPLTNIGNERDELQIMAGSKSATTSAITGFRRSFYGTTKDKNALTSDTIRALSGKSSGALKNGSTFRVPIPVGALRVVIAYPATLNDLEYILNSANFDFVTGFEKSTFQVEGANGHEAIEYKVYILNSAQPISKADEYSVKIKA